MLTLNCINLDHRKDRMNKINKLFSNQNLFKIKRFNAISNSNGALGCLSSHLEIIKSNYENQYVIVIEDDIILKESLENLHKIINKLLENISKWEIFNGNPSFWNIISKDTKEKNIIHSHIENTPFVNIKWGQSTAFMIYSKKSYDKLINILGNQKNENFKPIDLLISENFIQTCYRLGHLVYQGEDWSDISNRNMSKLYLHGKEISYIDYQKKCESLLSE